MSSLKAPQGVFFVKIKVFILTFLAWPKKVSKESQGLRFFWEMPPPAVPARYNSPRWRIIIPKLLQIWDRVGVQTVTLRMAFPPDSLRHHLFIQKNLRPVLINGKDVAKVANNKKLASSGNSVRSVF